MLTVDQTLGIPAALGALGPSGDHASDVISGETTFGLAVREVLLKVDDGADGHLSVHDLRTLKQRIPNTAEVLQHHRDGTDELLGLEVGDVADTYEIIGRQEAGVDQLDHRLSQKASIPQEVTVQRLPRGHLAAQRTLSRLI